MKRNVLFSIMLLFICASCCNNPPMHSTTSYFISLSSLYSWINEVEVKDIDYITSKNDVGTIQPSFYHAYNTFNIAREESEISGILLKVKNLTVKKEEDPLWAGGTSYALTFKLKNGDGYTLTSYYNGFSIDNDYYVYDSNGLPSCSTYYGRQFVWHSISDFKLYHNDEEVSDVSSSSIQSFLYDVRYKESESNEAIQDNKFEGYTLKKEDDIEVKIISDKVFNVIMGDTNKICSIESENGFSKLI